jgi:uncharacterized membrane protein
MGVRQRGTIRALSISAGTGLIAYSAVGRSRMRALVKGGIDDLPIQRVITIGKPKQELYAQWRDPAFLSSVFGGIFEVTNLGSGQISVHVELPAGRSLHWTAQLIEDPDGSTLRWRTGEDAPLPYEMFVHLRDADPADWGTEVMLGFSPICGNPIVKSIVGSSGPVTRTVLEKVLRRFKALLEAGEIPTLSKNPAGTPRLLAAA